MTNPESKKSAIFCGHANEVPMVCKCADDCYCRSNTCNTFRNETSFESKMEWEEEFDKKFPILMKHDGPKDFKILNQQVKQFIRNLLSSQSKLEKLDECAVREVIRDLDPHGAPKKLAKAIVSKFGVPKSISVEDKQFNIDPNKRYKFTYEITLRSWDYYKKIEVSISSSDAGMDTMKCAFDTFVENNHSVILEKPEATLEIDFDQDNIYNYVTDVKLINCEPDED